jgi:hypothetical protein
MARKTKRCSVRALKRQAIKSVSVSVSITIDGAILSGCSVRDGDLEPHPIKVYHNCDSRSIRYRLVRFERSTKMNIAAFLTANCVNGVVANQRGVGGTFE